MTALDLIVLVLTAYRITRLITTDSITEPARDWLNLHTGGGRSWVLVTCPFCAGFWVSCAVVLAAHRLGHDMPLPWLMPWAVAGGQSLLSALDHHLED